MIITKTPFRISFVGGGSDLPSFYRQYGGKVLSTTIDKYMYISLHPTFQQEKTIIKYSKTEIVDDIANIQHPIARQVLQNHHVQGVEVVSTADVIAGTGLSTSSAYTVGLIHAISTYKHHFMYKKEIAAEACIVEINQLKEPIGKQDQYGTAIGGLKTIEFFPDDSI
jgi:D-glycero-alpha-D-manno-heptose-7-phosphate kinase